MRKWIVCSLLLICFACNNQTKGKETVSENPHVKILTTYGVLEIELFADQSPETVKNFLRYVDEKHYDGTIFHRVIDGFMIQGGGMTASMQEKKTHTPITNEATNGLSNKRGTLAMARTSAIHSATSQFFINVVDNPFLDYQSPGQYGYCVFGEVKEGMDVVDRIRSVKTTSKKGHQNVPIEAIEIIEVSRENL